MRLSDIAQVIRSKNAGPRRLTLDIMFGSETDYQRVVQSPALGANAIGQLYRVPADDVRVIPTMPVEWSGVMSRLVLVVASTCQPGKAQAKFRVCFFYAFSPIFFRYFLSKSDL